MIVRASATLVYTGPGGFRLRNDKSRASQGLDKIHNIYDKFAQNLQKIMQTSYKSRIGMLVVSIPYAFLNAKCTRYVNI